MNQSQKSSALNLRPEELADLLTEIQFTINTVNQTNGMGDKPRVVGTYFSQHRLFDVHRNILLSDDMSWAMMRRIIALWDEAADEESVEYQIELYNEFKLGLTFFDEALSY